jgi:GMP synthase (glutamine-hydrolysing)
MMYLLLEKLQTIQLKNKIMQDIEIDRILILDFGSQYTQLIARRVRECGVYSEIVDAEIDDGFITEFKPKGIILSGGPESVFSAELKAPEMVFQLGCPVLGICYGMQTMAEQLGGKVELSTKQEFGFRKLSVTDETGLFSGVELDRSDNQSSTLNVWMSHGDKVTLLPEGFAVTATTETTPIAAMSCQKKHFYGLQFHPEVTHTDGGLAILKRFVIDICACDGLWRPENIIESKISALRSQVGSDKVLVALSGGVDSSVVAMLLHKAIGDQLTCVFVDTGLLRHNEGDQVMALFAEHLGVNVIRVNAAERFMSALSGVNEPEAKRKIVGEQFIRVFEEQAQKLEGIKWLGQGTIYPDVIESAKIKNGKAHVIKSHHNVGGLPENMNFELIEPLRELFKDEVREMGLELGLTRQLLYRHPFPGPGLALRILGEIKVDFIRILQQADVIFLEELHRHDLYDQVSQAFAVFLPVKSVGVKGDARVYSYVIALRAVETVDFMTARWARLPYDFIGLVSNRIMNEISEVARVVYDVSGKPPATIEWE